MNVKAIVSAAVLCVGVGASLVFLWLLLTTSSYLNFAGLAPSLIALIPAAFELRRSLNITPEKAVTKHFEKAVPQLEQKLCVPIIISGDAYRKETLVVDENSIRQLAEVLAPKVAAILNPTPEPIETPPPATEMETKQDAPKKQKTHFLKYTAPEAKKQ